MARWQDLQTQRDSLNELLYGQERPSLATPATSTKPVGNRRALRFRPPAVEGFQASPSFGGLGVGTGAGADSDTVIHPGLQIVNVPSTTQKANQSQSVYDANQQSDQDTADLADLKQQYTDLWNQWKAAKANTTTAMNQYVARLDPNNGINQKNVFLPASSSETDPTDTDAGYTTRKGIFKPYASLSQVDNLQGQRGCPALDTGWTSVPNAGYTAGMAVGSLLSSNPELVVGTPMQDGQSCGFEGENVYVSTLVSQPKSSYLGCYFDRAPHQSVAFVPTMTAPTTQGFAASASSELDSTAYPAWKAFDADPDTFWHSNMVYNDYNGSYEGQTSLGGYNGEFITILCPTARILTKYAIQGRLDCCGTPNNRDPYSWVVLGRSGILGGDWVLLDTRSGVSFKFEKKSFDVSSTVECMEFALVILVVGPSDYNCNSVQISSWELFADSTDASDASAISNGDTAMTLAVGAASPATYADCQNYAVENAYPYFALQDGTCRVSNDMAMLKRYGDATQERINVILWRSNTAGQASTFYMPPDNSPVLLDDAGNVVLRLGPDMTATSTTTTTPPTTVDGTTTDDTTSQDQQQQQQQPQQQQQQQMVMYVVFDNNSAKIIHVLSGQTDADGNQVVVPLWSSNTDDAVTTPNPAWEKQYGLYGIGMLWNINIFGAGLLCRLQKSEWISNDDGSLRLLMQDDGDLVLMTSQIVPGCTAAPRDDGANGILHWDPPQGMAGVNAVYQVDTQGFPAELGKMAYLDEDGTRHTYAPEQLNYMGSQFVYKRNQRLAATQGQELSLLTTDTVEACQDACVAMVGSAGAGVSCAAAVWQKDTQTCSLRDAASTAGGTVFDTAYDTLLRIPSIPADDSTGIPIGWSRQVNQIDSLQWQGYAEGPVQTNWSPPPSNFQNSTQQQQIDQMEQQLNQMAATIENKTQLLRTQNQNVSQQIRINTAGMSQQAESWKDIQILSQNGEEISQVQRILDDTQARAWHENAQLILWGIIALVAIIIMLRMWH